MIERIAIQNYRGIRELKIDGFKPINIFVGKNAVGKTSVLESLALAANPIPAEHFKLSNQRGLQASEFRESHNFDTIFNLHEPNVPVRIDFTYNPSALVNSTESTDYTVEIRPISKQELDNRKIVVLGEPQAFYGTIQNNIAGLQQTLYENKNVQTEQRIVPSDGGGYQVSGDSDALKKPGNFFIATRNPTNVRHLAELLSAKYVTVSWRESFLAQLRAIRPNIRDVYVLNNAIYVDIGAEQLLPLPLLGDGFNRIFLILVGLMASNQKTLMVDEIDSGLHHSIMDDFWDTLGKLVEHQGIQVFCTTHNEEMLDSLLDAFGPESELFKIYRIDRDKNGESKCVVYSPDRFDNALQFGFDVR